MYHCISPTVKTVSKDAGASKNRNNKRQKQENINWTYRVCASHKSRAMINKFMSFDKPLHLDKRCSLHWGENAALMFILSIIQEYLGESWKKSGYPGTWFLPFFWSKLGKLLVFSYILAWKHENLEVCLESFQNLEKY